MNSLPVERHRFGASLDNVDVEMILEMRKYFQLDKSSPVSLPGGSDPLREGGGGILFPPLGGDSGLLHEEAN